MVDFIGNNIRFKGQGVVGKSEVLPNGYGVMGNGAGLFEGNPFTVEWTVAGDATARTVSLPLVQNRAEGALSYDCVVDWGDGTTPSLVTSYNDANRIHTYASDGNYEMKVYGTMEGWSFNYGGDKDKLTKIVHWGDNGTFDGFKYLAGGFYGCSNLTDIGNSAIPASGTGILSDGFSNLFRLASSLTSISSHLFSNHPNAESFYGVFLACGITSIPSGLFDNNIGATGFNSAFYSSGITSIIPGLFDYCVAATRFDDCFRNTNIASIPSGLFNYCVLATRFDDCFREANITSIPSGLFDNNTAVVTFSNCFFSCSNLETSPSELFRFNTACLDFSTTFQECPKHQQNADLFYQDGEQSTRFLNQSVDFTECFDRASFTGTQGTAPDLWNCSFGTGTPTTTDCWNGAGNSVSSLTNYASIPGAWI